MITPRLVLFDMTDGETKMAQKIKTHILALINLFENRAVYDILWTKMVELNRPRMTVWDMRISC
jgi:hypothetical protein